MEIITIILVTDDFEYAKAMSTCVSEENKAIVFTIITSEEFENYDKTNEFNLILIDYLISNNEDNYINLIEKKTEIEQIKLKQTLYRYDTAENFSKRLTLLYCMKTGSKFISPMEKNCKTILFCSAAGGTGKTSIAIALAQELTRFHGKNVLYINYEELESTNRYFKMQEDKTVSNYLYYIETNKDFSGLIDNFIVSDEYGIKTFSAGKGRNQLKLLNIEELCKFIEQIQAVGEFDYILIDGDHSLNEEMLWLISICNKICKVEKWSSIGCNIKEDNFNNYLEHVFGKQIYDKITNVANCYIQQEDSCLEEDTKKIYIFYDESSFRTQARTENIFYTEINIERDFGNGIRQLSTKLTIN
ncbi:DEAD/DEAH box helicase family protein [Aminipila sp.]|uniref:DEAD/DEAH box helicase family protein n=1 Tax=Aminipila sp. TaxID=2060095 RepID=UPI002898DDC9|nr:DEAD/DEAH box helicase family protein [Aminipila sp.]